MKILRLAPVVALLSAQPVPVLSQPQRDLVVEDMHSEARIALVIGNGDYKDSPLRNPVNDAKAMAAALRETGFKVEEKANATKRQMFNAIRDFGSQIQRGGVGLFYYAGHGLQVKGQNYLVPVGTDIQHEDEVEFECIDAGLVLRKMESAGNRINIVILDACRNNPFSRSFRSGTRGLSQMDAATGSLLAYATAPGMVAADGEGANGLYTAMLLKHLKTPGMRIEQVFKNVRRDVMAASEDTQTPWESSSLTGDFFFVLTDSASTDKKEHAKTGPAPAPPPPLAIPQGYLQVNVTAPGSKVYIDGTHRGQADPGQPLNISGLPVAEVEVRAEAEGFDSVRQKVQLIGNTWVQVLLEARAKTAAKEEKKTDKDKEDETAKKKPAPLPPF